MPYDGKARFDGRMRSIREKKNGDPGGGASMSA